MIITDYFSSAVSCCSSAALQLYRKLHHEINSLINNENGLSQKRLETCPNVERTKRKTVTGLINKLWVSDAVSSAFVNELTRFVFGQHQTICNISHCMMGFFQITSMLFILWIFFHLPRTHCDVFDAIIDLHTWNISPSMENKVYPVIVYNYVYNMYSGYIYNIH